MITPSITTPEVTIHGGKAVTTSIAVAEYFQKTHDNVLKKIRSVIAECEPEYHVVNFNEVVREVPGGDGAIRKMPMFELTRDAFVLIVMGFTGKKALQWKIDYINAFNKMEAALNGVALEVSKGISQEEKDAYNINALVQHYMVMFDAWRYQIEPALRKIESPLAGRLHDRFGDGYAFLQLVEKSLNTKLLPGQSPRIL